jgi:hypothetical protein
MHRIPICQDGWRLGFLRGVVFFGAALALLTEVLGALRLLRPLPLLLCWAPLALLAVRRARLPGFRRTAFEWFSAAALVLMAVLLAVLALRYPPNSADALAYHMPRVVYWAQSASVDFFPTDYYNQVMLQPLAEYFILHTYILTGSDRFANLVQLFGFLASAVAASGVAARLGASPRGQALAALLAATIPNGILQATGAKNDCLAALYTLSTAYFVLRSDRVLAGLSLSLALFTKGTAYLFALPFLPLLGLRALPAAALAVLLLNGPLYLRNYRLSGSPLGFDSARGDGEFRWRNEPPSLGHTVSNLLRNTAMHLPARSERWNQGVYHAVVAAHRFLGVDPSSPATTWRYEQFRPPRNSNHEADAPNRWHLLLIVLVLPVALARPRLRLYAAALLAGGLAFCFYLKWMPWIARLQLPWFAAAVPLAAVVVESVLPRPIHLLLALGLLNNARPYLFENWTRPWRTTLSREDRYFTDMGQFNNRSSYLQTVELLARSGCDSVGIDIRHFTLEYPLQALLLRRNPRARFSHVPSGAAPLCAVVCLRCAGDEERLARYRALGPPVEAGEFSVFLGKLVP